MIRRTLWASCIAAGIVLYATRPASAIIPVEDYAAITRLFQQVQQMQQMLSFAQSQLRALTNIPGNLIHQAEGLLSLGISNPLGDIQGTLSSLMNGGPLTGTCAGAASGIISANRYGMAGGSDFSGAWINSSSSRLGGVMSCLNTMTRSTQDRLDQMPQLLSDIQSCNDVACATAINGRINLEQATIAAQTQQAILMGQMAQAQRWTAEDQVTQKIRRDAEATMQGTSGDAGGTPMATTPQAPSFAAFNTGG